MPSSITHQLIAEQALALFPPKLKKIVQSAPDEYFLGAQGPDMLFFHKIVNRKEFNFGRYLHRFRIFDAFTLFAQILRQGKNDARIPLLKGDAFFQAYAYILGYITHYAADSTFHPFVYNYLAKYHGNKIVHQQIENDWDVYFARKIKQVEAEYFPFAFSAQTVIAHNTVARIFVCLASHLERDEVNPRQIDNSIRNFTRYLKFFHGKCYDRGDTLEKAENLFHSKRYLSTFYPRKTPDEAFLSGKDYNALANGRGNNADELFAQAVAESKRCAVLFFKAVKRNVPLQKKDFGLGLLTGEIV